MPCPVSGRTGSCPVSFKNSASIHDDPETIAKSLTEGFDNNPNDGEPMDASDGDDEEASDQELNVEKEITGDGGVKKTILVRGKGFDRPSKGSKVEVHYVGTLEDGTQFDSSRSRNKPFTFDLGKGQVIRGWDEGVATMKKGEKCILRIRDDYGYGKNGSPPKIPGGAVLLFEVELLHFSNEVDVTYGKKTVMKRTMVDGEDWKTPSDFAKVTVKFTFAPALPPYSELASNEGREEGPGDVFTLGEDEAFPGFETAVRSMKKGEQATVTIDASEATPSPLCKIKGLPTPGISLKGTMHLVDFVNEKELYEMSSEEKLETAERFKALGNTAFKENRLANALNKYEHARNLARSIRTPTDDDDDDPQANVQAKAHKAAGNALTVVLHCNIAAVQLKLKDYAAAKEACDDALKMDAKCVKALLRRAQARRLKGDHELAVKDCDALLDIEPDNKEAKDLKALSQREAAAAQKKMDSMYSKMFSALGGSKD